MQIFEKVLSPLGEIVLAAEEDALIGLWFSDQKYALRGLSAEAVEGSAPVLTEAKRWLEQYFSGAQPDFLPVLQPGGTAFQQAVWQELLRIPYGGTSSYGTIAAALAAQRGLPQMSARAVGSAVGRNPISLMIPCHRVLGADGSLTGYAGGLERKKALLRLEQGENIPWNSSPLPGGIVSR